MLITVVQFNFKFEARRINKISRMLDIVIWFEIVFHSHFKCFTKGGSQFFHQVSSTGFRQQEKILSKQKTTNENALLPSSTITHQRILEEENVTFVRMAKIMSFVLFFAESNYLCQPILRYKETNYLEFRPICISFQSNFHLEIN